MAERANDDEETLVKEQNDRALKRIAIFNLLFGLAVSVLIAAAMFLKGVELNDLDATVFGWIMVVAGPPLSAAYALVIYKLGKHLNDSEDRRKHKGRP